MEQKLNDVIDGGISFALNVINVFFTLLIFVSLYNTFQPEPISYMTVYIIVGSLILGLIASLIFVLILALVCSLIANLSNKDLVFNEEYELIDYDEN